MSSDSSKIFSKLNNKMATLFRAKSASVTSLTGPPSHASNPNGPVSCSLCGHPTATVRCDKCDSSAFCVSCDDAYHRHPKRRFHYRKSIPVTVKAPEPQVSSMSKTGTLTRPPAFATEAAHPSKMPVAPPRARRSVSRAGSTETVNSVQAGHPARPGGDLNTLRRFSDKGPSSNFVPPKSFEATLDEWAARSATLNRRGTLNSGGASSSDLSVDYVPQASDIQFTENRHLRNVRQRSNSMSRRNNYSLHDLNANYEQMAFGQFYPPVPPPFMAYNQYVSPWAGHPGHHHPQYYQGRDDEDDGSSGEESQDEEDEDEEAANGSHHGSRRSSSRLSSGSRKGRTATLKRTKSNGSFNGGNVPWGIPPPPPPMHSSYMGYPPYAYYQQQMAMQGGSPPRSVRSVATSGHRGRHRAQSIGADSTGSSAKQTRDKKGSKKHANRSAKSSKSQAAVSAASSRYQSDNDEDDDSEDIDDEEFFSSSGDERRRLSSSRVQGWTCRYCTFSNEPSVEICDVCGKSSPRRRKQERLRVKGVLETEKDSDKNGSNSRNSSNSRPQTPKKVIELPQPSSSPEEATSTSTENGIDLNDELVREQLEIEQEMKRRQENERRIAAENAELEAKLGTEKANEPSQKSHSRQEVPKEPQAFTVQVSVSESKPAEQFKPQQEKVKSIKPQISISNAKISNGSNGSSEPPLEVVTTSDQPLASRQLLMPTPPPQILSQPNPPQHLPNSSNVGDSNHFNVQSRPDDHLENPSFDQWVAQHANNVQNVQGRPQHFEQPQAGHGSFFPEPQAMSYHQDPMVIRRPPLPFEQHRSAPPQMSTGPLYGSMMDVGPGYATYGAQRPNYHGSMTRLDQVGPPQSYVQGYPGSQPPMSAMPSMSRFNSHDELPSRSQYFPSANSSVQAQQMATGLEMIQVLREAERRGFNADEVEIAFNFNANNPIDWLDENWGNMVETVLTLANNQLMQNEKKRNKSKRGILELSMVTQAEVRVALRITKGNIWQAIEKCVQRKEEEKLTAKESAASKHYTFEFNELGSGRDNLDAADKVAIIEDSSNKMNSLLEKWSRQAAPELSERRSSAKDRFLTSVDQEDIEAEEALRRYLMEKYIEGDLDSDEESDLAEELGLQTGYSDDDDGHDEEVIADVGEYLSDQDELQPCDDGAGVDQNDDKEGGDTSRPSSIEQLVGDLVEKVALEAAGQERPLELKVEFLASPPSLEVKLVQISSESELERVRRVHTSSNFGYARNSYECELCTGIFGIRDMVSLLACEHQACVECLRAYFNVQIRERHNIVIPCPFCAMPDLDNDDDDGVYDYLGLLDQMIKTLMPPELHDLFQSKVRDRALAKDPNFKWCTYCSSGYIASNPRAKTIMCPDCKVTSCVSCGQRWEPQHYGISCEQFAEWKLANDPAFADLELDKHLRRHGIVCPKCSFQFELTKGGCMHFHCVQCAYDFCGACKREFIMGTKCKVSKYCEKLGLHAHHPRNCLFYLRDKEPAELQQLLENHNVDYAISASDAALAAKGCPVMEQKEGACGLCDEPCNRPNEFFGSCRTHYIEYLGEVIMKHNVDPIDMFDEDQLEQVMRRADIKLPVKCPNYKGVLIELIMKECPLGKSEV